MNKKISKKNRERTDYHEATHTGGGWVGLIPTHKNGELGTR